MGMGALDSHVRMDNLLRPDVDYDRPRGGGKALFDLVGDLRGLRILDLGCGLGRYRRTLEQRGARWIGVDLSAQGCTVVADGERLPFPDECFDGLLSAAVLEHLPDPDRSLQEMRRVLRPGARLFGYVAFLEQMHGMSYFHMSHLGLEVLLLKHGFQPQRIYPGQIGLPSLLEQILFPKRLPGIQPLVRGVARLAARSLLALNRWSREVLTLARGIPAAQRKTEREQYRRLLALRHAAGFNFIAVRAAPQIGPATGYRSLVQSD